MSDEDAIIRAFGERRVHAEQRVNQLREELATIGQQLSELGTVLEDEPECVVAYKPRTGRPSDENKTPFLKPEDVERMSEQINEFHKARNELKELNRQAGINP